MNTNQPVEKRFYLTFEDNRHITYKETLNKIIEEYIDYYNSYGKDGFLSEKMNSQDIIPHAITKAKVVHRKNQECQYSLNCKIIYRDTEEQDMKEVESRPDFVKWVTADDISTRN